MTLFILTETSAGYALLKARDKKLLKRDDIAEQGSTAQGVCDMLKLRKFAKFDSAAVALEEAASIQESKVTPMLANLLESIKEETKASLAVADPKLGNAIKKLPELEIKPISDSSTNDLFRAIRGNIPSLIPGLVPDDLKTMSLGLSHSLSRHRLKFSPDKVDTMIIHAIGLLDELDKELNTYAMRVKEWYGWHFPEMAKIINDNMAYARVILKVGFRTNASKVDLEDILPEEIETAIKAAAEISMGTDITDDDLDNIKMLAEQVVDFCEYRAQLSSYLSTRMQAIAPNLTALVGELVGARLIANCGSLLNLAKSPASTIQILGAEKALFRALKSKHDTPKYGLIYHASLVGQASGKNKGKIARMLATKTALGLRVDSLSDWGVTGRNEKAEPTDEEKSSMALDNRLKIERRLRSLEGKPLAPRGVQIGPSGQAQPAKFALNEARKYNTDADGLANKKRQADESSEDEQPPKKSKLIEEVVEDAEMDDAVGGQEESDSESDAADEPAPRSISAMTNGHSTSSGPKDAAVNKAILKAEKAKRKAERAAKRERKAAKRAAKEAKKASKEANGHAEKAKRKRDDDDGGHKKSKKSKRDR